MWNMEASRTKLRMRYNEGLSLVEVLIALAVGSIVVMGVASLIFASLRLYGTSNANVELQNESQTAMNLVVDTVMGAKGLCMKVPENNTDNTNCILLGEYLVVEVAGQYSVRFNGTVVAFSETKNEMYLIDLADDEADFPDKDGDYCILAGLGSDKEVVQRAGLDRVIAHVDDLINDNKVRPWLMSRYVTSCRFTLPEDTLSKGTNNTGDEVYYFLEPISLHIELGFEYKYNNKTATRKLEDDAAIRSRLKNIYIHDTRFDDASWAGIREFKRR